MQFVENDSVVRTIWGKSDTILFIFAGASAEFARNKAVDWLYFTGKLPADLHPDLRPKNCFFVPERNLPSRRRLAETHRTAEQNRSFSVRDWAYRDVLSVLIHYSIASYGLLERKLTMEEKEEVYRVVYRVGERMGLKELPSNYSEWLPVRRSHLRDDLQKSAYLPIFFKQYRKHRGAMRYRVLIEGQKLVEPDRIKELLHVSSFFWLGPIVPLYKMSRPMSIDWLFESILLPSEYKDQINELDTHTD